MLGCLLPKSVGFDHNPCILGILYPTILGFDTQECWVTKTQTIQVFYTLDSWVFLVSYPSMLGNKYPNSLGYHKTQHFWVLKTQGVWVLDTQNDWVIVKPKVVGFQIPKIGSYPK